MKTNRPSIVLSIVALVFLAVLRIAGASVIMSAVPAPYGAGMISTLGVLTVIAVAIVVDRLVRFFYWDDYRRRRLKRDTPALIEDLLTIALVVLGASVGQAHVFPMIKARKSSGRLPAAPRPTGPPQS